MTAMASAALVRLTVSAGRVAQAAALFADADLLTAVAAGLKRDGLPEHATRAQALAAKKHRDAETLLRPIR